jgi:LacI family transcriptional regulator
MHGETARPVIIDQLPEVLKEYSAFIFHEASPVMATVISELVNNNVPVVVANLEIDLNVSATCVDHSGISMKAVETVASFGHKRIAYVGRNPEHVFYGKFLDGFRKGMLAVNLNIDNDLIALCGNINLLDAYRATLPLLRRSDTPTAIVAARDFIAAGVCEAIREAGLEVGRDISVIGFDDVSWDGPEPFLTTFHEPCTEMGSEAVDMLLDRITDPLLPTEQRVLDAPLLLRRSVGLPARHDG